MKKYLFVFLLAASIVFSGFGMVAIADAGVVIDVSRANFQAIGPDEFRVANITVPGLSGTYWVVLKWDPEALVLVPVARRIVRVIFF